jgi:hypothetical protein
MRGHPAYSMGLRSSVDPSHAVPSDAWQTEFLLLAIYNKPRLSLREVCEAIGMSMQTAYNQRSADTFPVPMSGDPLHADIRDVRLPGQAAPARLGRLASSCSKVHKNALLQNCYTPLGCPMKRQPLWSDPSWAPPRAGGRGKGRVGRSQAFTFTNEGLNDSAKRPGPSGQASSTGEQPRRRWNPSKKLFHKISVRHLMNLRKRSSCTCESATNRGSKQFLPTRIFRSTPC